jgi:large subunit ribosomal protein L15
MKLKRRKKSARFRGSRMHGRSAKKAKGKGHHGGKGWSGTGKKAAQKKTYIDKFFSPYFGKSGQTSKPTKKRKEDKINLGDIDFNKYGKKTSNGWEVNLSEYKVLGEGEIKEKVVIKAKAFSQSAKEKIEKAGGKALSGKEAL